MSLAVVVDALGGRLSAALPGAATFGDTHPAAPGDLPAVTITVAQAEQELIGIGRLPRASRRGALPVSDTVDLADPTLDVAGEEVRLLSDNRRVLTLAHGPVVRSDGTDQPPFTADDLTVADDGGPYAVVAVAPAGRQVRVDHVRGELHFGQPLPAAGTLTATYRLGEWEVATIRYSGLARLAVATAGAAATADLSRRVATTLALPHAAFGRMSARAWGGARAAPLGNATAVSRELEYRFDFELEEPSLPTAGGLIRTVAVTSRSDAETELFDVPASGGDE